MSVQSHSIKCCTVSLYGPGGRGGIIIVKTMTDLTEYGETRRTTPILACMQHLQINLFKNEWKIIHELIKMHYKQI